jgi:hypothetical protein
MSSDEKLQLVAFSTNDTTDTRNDIINTFLSKHIHSILKQTRHTYGFQTELPGTNKQTKILIYSVLDLQKEYPGIKDVNCYIMFINIEEKDSIEKFNEIITYLNKYCDDAKKIFLIGFFHNADNIVLTMEELTGMLEDNHLQYEYKQINLEKKSEVEKIFLEILDYSTKHPIKEFVKSSNDAKSCSIY